MPYTVEQKIKLLVLWDILCRNTDETKLGKNGEIVSEKVQKTAIFGLKSGKNGTFLKWQFASDSVIRC